MYLFRVPMDIDIHVVYPPACQSSCKIVYPWQKPYGMTSSIILHWRIMMQARIDFVSPPFLAGGM